MGDAFLLGGALDSVRRRQQSFARATESFQGSGPKFRPVADNFQRAKCVMSFQFFAISCHSERSEESPQLQLLLLVIPTRGG
jgi:hypothetical protein